jgi:L-threonylcarbamoyladenylate synthase
LDMHKVPETLKNNRSGIEHALKILKRGGVVAFPTETLYGFGAIATNNAAVKRIYKIKGRKLNKSLPVIIGDMKQAKKYFTMNRNDLMLANKFWPGPLSLILKTRSKKLKTSLRTDLIAVRLSASPLAAKLARMSGAPIISTSANISGSPGCLTVDDIKDQFANISASRQPDIFLDGGKLKSSVPSTIVRTEENGILIVREGKIKPKDIIRAIRS